MNSKILELKTQMENEQGFVVPEELKQNFKTNLLEVVEGLKKHIPDIKLDAKAFEFEILDETELDDEEVNFESQNSELKSMVDVVYFVCLDDKKIPIAVKTVDDKAYSYRMQGKLFAQDVLASVTLNMLSCKNKPVHTPKGEKDVKPLFVSSFHSAHKACIYIPKLNRVMWEIASNNFEQTDVLSQIQKRRNTIVLENEKIKQAEQQIDKSNAAIRRAKDEINTLKKQSKTFKNSKLEF